MLLAINNFHGKPVLIKVSDEMRHHIITIVEWSIAGDDIVMLVSTTGATRTFDSAELVGEARSGIGANELDGAVQAYYGFELEDWLLEHERPSLGVLSKYETDGGGAVSIQDGIRMDDPALEPELTGDRVPVVVLA